MKKIVIIRSNGVNPDSRVEKEVESLIELGYDVKVLAWDRDSNYRFKSKKMSFDRRECEIVRYGIKSEFGSGLANLIPLVKSQIMILRYLIKNRKNIDVIHACDFDTAFSSFIIAKIFNKRMVYDIFDYYIDAFSVPNKLKKIIEWLDIKIINNSDAVIIVNEARREQIKKSRPKNLYIIHNSPKFVYDEEKSNNSIEHDEALKICYVGILAESRFLKEVAEIISKDKKYQLYIGGFGSLESYFMEMGQTYENINFLGKMKYKDVIKLEQDSDILIAVYDPKIPNHKYSSPNKLYEALMLGKPIIVAKGTGIDKIVDEMKIGRSVEYSVESFEEALNSLAKDLKYNKQSISEKCKKIYTQRYSWDEMEKRLGKLYSEL